MFITKTSLGIFISATALVILLTMMVVDNFINASTRAASSPPVKVKAGTGNGTVAQTAFSPQVVEIKAGESITWYNPLATAPEPHTVSFVFDNKSMTDVVSAFAVSNSTKFMPLPPNSNNEPTMGPPVNGMNTIIAINGRVFNAVVIDSSGNVKPLGQNVNYTITGNEKYVNSGFLVPKGQEQLYPGSSSTFTVIFDKAGTYNYLCLLHPYMQGTVLVR